jgi:hypothetical protein
VRRALYFRLMREGHRERWRECISEAMLEFDAVRAALALKTKRPAPSEDDAGHRKIVAEKF